MRLCLSIVFALVLPALSEVVVEELVFQVDPADSEYFITQDQAIWTQTLAEQPGFLKKEVWHDRKKPELVKLAIHWQSMGDWMRVPKPLLKKTDQRFREAMGDREFKMISGKAYDWKGETFASQPSHETYPEFDLASIDATEWSDRAEDIHVPHDGVHHAPKNYRAYKLKTLLEHWLTLGDYVPEEWEIVFECEDGYAPSTSLERALSEKAYLAFADREAPEGQAFVPKKKGNGDTVTFAPFYGVWTFKDAKAANQGPWPYNLTKLKLVPKAKRYQSLKPKDAQHEAGFQLYREHCIRCHAIGGIGGVLGPELHEPRNVTEYWKAEPLAAFILNPQATRTGSKMPPMSYLGEDKVAQIIDYLEALAQQRSATP